MCFTQLRATLALMGAEPAGEVVAHSLDVDPAKTEPILAAAANEARRVGNASTR